MICAVGDRRERHFARRAKNKALADASALFLATKHYTIQGESPILHRIDFELCGIIVSFFEHYTLSHASSPQRSQPSTSRLANNSILSVLSPNSLSILLMISSGLTECPNL